MEQITIKYINLRSGIMVAVAYDKNWEEIDYGTGETEAEAKQNLLDRIDPPKPHKEELYELKDDKS